MTASMCCLPSGDDGNSQQRIWEQCAEMLRVAINEQLAGESSPVLIDAIPTTGKTHAAASVVGELDEQVIVLSHLHETRNTLEERIESESVVRLPSLKHDCPTVNGDNPFGEELLDQNARGGSPYFLHKRRQNELPCMEEGDCPYVEQREAAQDADVLIGHPTHALSQDLVAGRVLIFDESPGDAYQTVFPATARTRAVNQFLQGYDKLDINRIDQVEALALLNEVGGVESEELVEELSSIDAATRQTEVLKSNGHAEAPSITLATFLLKKQQSTDLTGNQTNDTYAASLRQNLDLDYVQLADGMSVVDDLNSGELHIRRPPDLSDASAIVGLDGTPQVAVWKGKLGLDEMDHRQLLCDSCRRTYLAEYVGYDRSCVADC